MEAGRGPGNEGEELAEWLKDAGRRAPRAAPTAPGSDESYNSPSSLHHYLEELAGRQLRTHTEVLAFLNAVAGTQPHELRVTERRRMMRELTLIAVLALSYLHFYYWQVQLEIAALSTVRTFLPAQAFPPSQQKKT